MPEYKNNSVEVCFQRAFSLEMDHKLIEAQEEYSKVIDKTDGVGANAGNSLFRLAWIAMTGEEHVKAVKYFHKATHTLKALPDCEQLYKEALYWLALSYEALGQPLQALEYYTTTALADDSSWFWDVSFRKIQCYDTIGKYEEALACCHTFLEVRPEDSSGIRKKAEFQPRVAKIHALLERLLLER